MTSSIAVATVLTVYGIETTIKSFVFFRLFKLQQYLPFTVLKPISDEFDLIGIVKKLQQYLPFTVLKQQVLQVLWSKLHSCNSTYRLRY